MRELSRVRLDIYARSIVISCLVLAFAFACTVTDKSQPNSTGGAKSEGISELSKEEQQRLEDWKAEMEIGRNMAGRLLQYYGAYEDEALVRYLNEIASLLASHSPFSERRFMIEILNYEQPNAFACPGGYILVSLGALRHAENEAELAAVIAHEIAHIGLQHMYKKLQEMNEKELNDTADDKNAGIPDDIAVRKRPDPEQSELFSSLARYMTGSVAGLNILKAAKEGMTLMLEKGLGAELEFEADYEGVRYAINAGYQPSALINYLCRLETRRGGTRESCYQSSASSQHNQTILDRTHPPVNQRINKIQGLLQEIDANQIVAALGERRFLHYKARLSQAGKP